GRRALQQPQGTRWRPRPRVDLDAAIRRDARAGLSGRALQRKHAVGYHTVTAALESAWPRSLEGVDRLEEVAARHRPLVLWERELERIADALECSPEDGPLRQLHGEWR